MTFLPKVSGIITSDAPLEEKIGAIADAYFAILKENPQLPMFLMKEAMRDFEGFVQMALGINISQAGNNFFSAIESEMEAGKIKKFQSLRYFSMALSQCRSLQCLSRHIFSVKNRSKNS